MIRPGIDVLLDDQPGLLRGRRVGLITNPTGVDRQVRSIVERLRATPGVTLAALYGPEHGVRGNAQAGEYVPFHHDDKFGLPVYSLYGQTAQPPPDQWTNLDATMRDYDTRHDGKMLAEGMLSGIDVLVYDLQDVGTRVYTYVATMAYALEAAAAAGIPFVVLDRPNPIGGTHLEGPILEYPRFSSFIGLYPVPLRHGMTAGELARLFNARFLPRAADLTVVPVDGWRRTQWFDDTGLPWVLPSPNMPTLDTAAVYPGQVLLEGTNLSEGRGTTRPFELFGSPWIDAYELTRTLNALGLPGVAFREAWFTPSFSKFTGQRCGGCQLHVTDRLAFQPVVTTLAILGAVRDAHGDRLELHGAYFDHVMGTDKVRKAFLTRTPAGEIAAEWEAALEQFKAERQDYLLYT